MSIKYIHSYTRCPECPDGEDKVNGRQVLRDGGYCDQCQLGHTQREGLSKHYSKRGHFHTFPAMPEVK